MRTDVRLAAWRWASVVAALLAFAIVVAYAVEPLDLPTRRDRSLFLFAQMAYWLGPDKSASPGIARAILLLLAGVSLGASVLALVLALRKSPTTAQVRLGAGFAFGALAAAIFFFVEPLPQFRAWLGLDDSRALAALVRFTAATSAAIASLQGVRFFLVYPNTVLEQDYRRLLESRFRDAADAALKGWRARVYPFWLKSGALGDSHRDRVINWQTGVFRWLSSGASLIVGVALAAIGTLAFSAPSGDSGGKAATVIILLFPVLMLVHSVNLLRIQRDNGSAQDRHRTGWIWGSLFVGGAVYSTCIVAGFALFVLLALVSPETLGRAGGLYLMGLPLVMGTPLFAALIVASFAFAIFYRGAVDPNLAARKLTVWGVLGILVVFVFVLIERAIASKVIAWLGLSPDSGAIVAGAGIAATIAPLRRRTEQLVQDTAARYLPLDSLVQGERRSVAIAFSDLSGYTALSARDEASAHLLAALLQKQARIVSEKHDVRVVKAMGDAVMLETDSAPSMASALLELHEAFPRAANVIGLEPLPVHSGLHWGEVVEAADGDLYGQAVNLTARIQGEAKPGQIACSADFLAAASMDVTKMEFLGARQLKGVPEPLPCYALGMAPALPPA